MKLPYHLARFINWVEGEDIAEAAPMPERKTASPAAPKKRRLKHISGSILPPSADHPVFRVIYDIISVLVCLTLVATLLITVSYLPRFGGNDNPAENEVYTRYLEEELSEAGAVNAVAGMILDYRAFDTLGESNVLFIAVCSVIILLRADYNSRLRTLSIPQLSIHSLPRPDNDIFRAASMVLVPVGMLFGIYIILNGHLSAGGGFSGGAVIGACLILYTAANGPEKLEKYFTFRTYQRISFTALITYTLLKTYSFYTGANGIESVVPLGTPGAILSSGLILPLNICVGLVVACTMYMFYALFSKGGLGNGQ